MEHPQKDAMMNRSELTGRVLQLAFFSCQSAWMMAVMGMNSLPHSSSESDPETRLLYDRIEMELSGILAGERDATANQANFAALLFLRLPDVNWVGFYRRMDDGLILGPFQGKPACVRLPASQGVCAAAAVRGETVVVADVHDFEGHIACDPLSRAEIVIPMIHQGQLLGVLDLDSPRSSRFQPADRVGLECLVKMLVDACDW